MQHTDTYKTIDLPTEEVLFKEKHSKFFGYVFPIRTEEEVKPILDAIKKQHHSARHWCYAWQLGVENQIQYRANDDGEPNNSAGMPIYGQIQSFEITNVLVIVVRYFGGIKLGVGGLISAYKNTAQMAIDKADIVEKTLNVTFEIKCDYKDLNKVMRILKEHQLPILSQQMEMDCTLRTEIRKSDAEQFENHLNQLYEITFKKL